MSNSNSKQIIDSLKINYKPKDVEFSWKDFFRSEKRSAKMFLRKKMWRILTLMIIVFVLIGGVFIQESFFKNRFLPGTSIGELETSYLSQTEVSSKLQQKISEFERDSWTLSFDDQEEKFFSWELGVEFSVPKTVEKTFSEGHSGNFLSDLKTRFVQLILQKKLSSPLEFEINQSILRENLARSFPELRKVDYKNWLIVKRDGSIVQKNINKRFRSTDIDFLVSEIKTAISSLEHAAIVLEAREDELDLSSEDISYLQKELDKYKDKEVTLYYRLDHRMKTWELTPGGDLKWFSFEQKDCVENKNGCRTLSMFFDEGKIRNYLKQEIAPYTNTESQEVKITYAEGFDAEICLKDLDKCQLEFEGFARNEEVLLLEEATSLVLSAIENDIDTVILPMKITPAKVIGLPELGFETLLTTGWSNATLHSSWNRIHNVKNGISKFNGMIIPEGETVSFNRRLGDVDGSTGYVQESVIKGDATVPEFGGGLCQVSSTFYRASMNSGLEIMDRTNHRYALDYYTPVGTDATIYPPNPDLKVKNNTPGNILVHTIMEDNRFVLFNFYGVSDGMSVVYEGPFITNWRKPPPAQYVKTSDLPVGKTKQVEWEAWGLDSTFVRIITKADGTKEREEIFSSYTAWPDRYLVGAPKEEVETTTPYVLD